MKVGDTVRLLSWPYGTDELFRKLVSPGSCGVIRGIAGNDNDFMLVKFPQSTLYVDKRYLTLQLVPHNLGPDFNSLLYWVRKLVHADCGDDAVRAVAELAKIEKQISGDR